MNKDADLLIHDAQYTDEEYNTYRLGWGHSSHGVAIETAKAANAGSLALFHHDPSHDDLFLSAAELRLQAQHPEMKLFMAAEGGTVLL